jgi:hypothetical protein
VKAIAPALRAAVAAAVAACGGSSDSPDAATPPDAAPIDAEPADADLNRYLSGESLYSDFPDRTLSADAIPYLPAYILWSDGAEKQRWLQLPAGGQIDTSDMDHWQFPVGTRVWKEFSLGGTLLETRLIEHVADTGDLSADWQFGSFVWRPDGSDAVYTTTGAMDVNGTQHDVPRSARCIACHQGEPGHVLGFSAIQLSHGATSGATTTLTSLADDGRLTDPPPAGEEYPVPGDAVTAAALGYLHANCGNCHNPNGPPFMTADTMMELRLDVADRDPTTTRTWLSIVNQPTDHFMSGGFTMRIVGLDPSMSAVRYRMTQRMSNEAMPPLATDIVDDDGVATIDAWILTLPPP